VKNKNLIKKTISEYKRIHSNNLKKAFFLKKKTNRPNKKTPLLKFEDLKFKKIKV